MKTIVKIAMLSLLMGIILTQPVLTSRAQSDDGTIYIKIQVDGLTCPFCAYGLEKHLNEIPNVKNVFISVENAYTTLEVPAENKPSEDDLRKVVADAGFTPTEIIFSEIPFENAEN